MIADDFLFTHYNYDPETDEVKMQEITVRDVITCEVISHSGLRFTHDEGWFRYNIEIKDGVMHLIKWNYDFVQDSFTGKEIGIIEDGIEVRRQILKQVNGDMYEL